MSVRRVKDIDYDEDELDDFEDDYEEGYEGQAVGQSDALSPEDEEQMRLGTAKVKSALGESYTVSESAIQDALWHYYFDSDKAIVYLKNQHASQQPKQQQPKPKQASRFDQAANAASQTPTKSKTGRSRSFLVNEYEHYGRGCAYGVARSQWLHQHVSHPQEWFKDVPWFNVPANVRTTFVEPSLPSLRLLGGSATGGKPSKLAALAAARKKKEAEAKENVNQAGAEESARSANAASMLDRLGTKPNRDATSVTSNVTPQASAPIEGLSKQRSYPVRKRKSPSPPPPPSDEADRPVAQRQQSSSPHESQQQDLRIQPSIFAQTMCSTRHGPQQATRSSINDIYSSLYSAYDLHETNPFAGPSPDDVVTQAQSKGSQSKQQTKQTPGKDGKSSITKGVASLSVEEPVQSTRIKSKNLDVPTEFARSSRKPLSSFVVIGHVDHGKSTLMGRLLLDLGNISQRSVDKHRTDATALGKSSFALAWVMDSTSEERERGVTVDIATNHFETEKSRFTILDAPGHKDFVGNMIAGASQADFAVLVIDAGTNSFESGLRGQTKEHALLVKSMGCSRVIVAVNKMDTAEWKEERFEEIRQQMTAFLVSANFKAGNLAFVPCAGLTGENIVKPVGDKASWYKGQTLVQALEMHERSTSAIDKAFRLQVADVFRGGVTNPVSVSGKIESGNVQIGDILTAVPAGENAVVKGIEADGEGQDWAVAGQIVDLHLAEIDPVHLKPGDVLCDAKQPVQLVKKFGMKILAFEHVYPMQVDVHRGRLHVPGRVSVIIGTLDKGTGQISKKRPKVVQPGGLARVEIELEAAIPIEVPQRVVLRSAGQTVAAGVLESLSR